MIKVKEIQTGYELREFRKSLNMGQETFGGTIGYKLNRISVVERKNLPLPPKVKKNLVSTYKQK